jgi:hypothetical protein
MTEPSRSARLWYQSFVHPTEQRPYIERLQDLLDRAASPGIQFEVHGLERSGLDRGYGRPGGSGLLLNELGPPAPRDSCVSFKSVVRR